MPHKILPLILLFFSFPPMATAQIQCEEVSKSVGIDYHYLSTTYMGGGAAFFDMDNDGDEDLWIGGGLNRNALYENDGSGGFTEIGVQAGLEVTEQYVSSGVVTADLDNDGYRDVLVMPHNSFNALLFRNNGNGTFSEISESAGIAAYEAQSHGVAFGDVNLDGYLDIYLSNYVETIRNIYDGTDNVVGFEHDCFPNYLFINNGDWTFSEQGAEYGVRNTGCALATTFTDFDQDADPDLMIANDFGEWITPNALYQNDYPNAVFSDISESSGMDVQVYGMGIAIGDYDQDLDLDYYITNLGRNVLLENLENSIFEDKTAERGVEDTYMGDLLATGWGTAFMDVDNDADLDLFVCNGYVPAAQFIANNKENRNRLFLNNGNVDGEGFDFQETALSSGLDNPGRGRGFAYADYDNDGDLDFLVINVNQHTSSDVLENVLLYRNDSDNGNHWLKVKLEGITQNRDAFGSTIKIVVGEKSWIFDYNGGFGSHAAQHSSIAHFGLGDAEMVDSLVVNWIGGEKNTFTDISSNQMIHITEDGIVTNIEQLGNQNIHQINAFPNPFEGTTEIRFRLEKADFVKVEIYNAMGKKLEEIQEGHLTTGTHSFHWTPPKTTMPSNYYLVKIQTREQTNTHKLIHIH